MQSCNKVQSTDECVTILSVQRVWSASWKQQLCSVQKLLLLCCSESIYTNFLRIGPVAPNCGFSLVYEEGYLVSEMQNFWVSVSLLSCFILIIYT